MKICMLTSTHKPMDIRIFHKEGKSLSKFFDVTIVAPDDHEWRRSVDGVNIVTFKRYKKILHFFNLWKLFREGLKQECDVYHCHEPDSLIVASIIKSLKRNCKIVYDVHEHWPSEIAYGWFKIKKKILRKFFESFLGVIERFLIKFVDGLIVVSESVGNSLRSSKGYTVIPNAPLLKFVQKLNQENKKDCDLVVVGGGLQSYHGLNDIILAISEVKKYYPEIKLKIVGNIQTDIEGTIKEMGLAENVVLTGFLPVEKMYEELCKAKIGLLILKNEYYNAYIGLPNKLFDYMLCGLAVIASDFPEIRKVVEKAKCGVLVNPAKIDEIVKAILYLIENPALTREMGAMGRKFVENEMNWEKVEERLIEFYKSLEKF